MPATEHVAQTYALSPLDMAQDAVPWAGTYCAKSTAVRQSPRQRSETSSGMPPRGSSVTRATG